MDGFRIDVAHGLVKDPDLPDLVDTADLSGMTYPPGEHPFADREAVLAIYESWRRVADEYPGQRMFVAEAWTPGPERLARYVSPGRLHTAFNFEYLMAPWDAVALRAAIDASTGRLADVGAPATWVLSNHDVVRHPSRYGRPAHERVGNATFSLDDPPDLELGTRRARAALLLEAALPGGMYVYQGEELGLPEVEDLPDDALQDPTWKRSEHVERGRDGARVPLPWSGDAPPYGFSPPGNAPTWLPQPAGWGPRTAAAQDGVAGSVLELYRTVLGLRRAHPALGEGAMTWVSDADARVLHLRREPGFACVVNLSPDAVALPAHTAVLVASGPLADGRLPTDTAVWLEL